MMQLGEIVLALRTANGWSQQQLAANITRVLGKKVNWQSIQQLEAKPNTRPRYIIELAGAFGKTVEELRAWRPGMPNYGGNRASAGRISDVPAATYAATQPPDEAALLDDYRQCSESTQKALRVMAANGRIARRKASN